MIAPLDTKAPGGDWLDAYLAAKPGTVPLYKPALAVALAAIASLPFVYVDVTMRSAGMIRPVAERQEIRAADGGTVAVTNLAEHTRVQAGTVLVQLGSAADDAEVEMLRLQLLAAARELHDLAEMTRSNGPRDAPAGTFQTEAWGEEYARFRGELMLRQLDVTRAQRELDRGRELAVHQAVTPNDIESREYALSQAAATVRQVRDRALATWKAAAAEKQVKRQELQSRYERATQDHALHTVTAPIDGSLEQVAAVTRGSYVRPGDLLAVISPDAAMVAEVYVQPRDIPWVRPHGRVRLQIDAFNYRDWGLLEATVLDVAGDVSIVDNKPFFRVRVRPDRPYLALANGGRGQLKKGMTLMARFVARKRSLWQLLRDNAADWIDPESTDAATVAVNG